MHTCTHTFTYTKLNLYTYTHILSVRLKYWNPCIYSKFDFSYRIMTYVIKDTVQSLTSFSKRWCDLGVILSFWDSGSLSEEIESWIISGYWGCSVHYGEKVSKVGSKISKNGLHYIGNVCHRQETRNVNRLPFLNSSARTSPDSISCTIILLHKITSVQ